MEKLHRTAEFLVKDAQTIADNLNPRFNGKRMSVKCIQHMIAVLAREYAILYGDIGEEK